MSCLTYYNIGIVLINNGDNQTSIITMTTVYRIEGNTPAYIIMTIINSIINMMQHIRIAINSFVASDHNDYQISIIKQSKYNYSGLSHEKHIQHHCDNQSYNSQQNKH